jgi:DnaJ-class molecular chaperone
VDPTACARCGGTGYVAKPAAVAGKTEGVAYIRLKCPACAGTGQKDSAPPTAG